MSFFDQLQTFSFAAKNTIISPNFLVWKFCGKAQFPQQEIRWNYDFFGSVYSLVIKPFDAAVKFQYPMKMSKKQMPSNNFRRYRTRPVAWNRLIYSVIINIFKIRNNSILKKFLWMLWIRSQRAARYRLKIWTCLTPCLHCLKYYRIRNFISIFHKIHIKSCILQIFT